MEASQAAAKAGAAGLPPFIAKMIELTLRIREARNELARFNALQGVKAIRADASGTLDILADKHSRARDAVTQHQAAARALSEAYDKQTLTVGTNAQKVKLLTDQYEALKKAYGAADPRTVDAQTALIQAQEAAQKRGGGARLSDQQKLHNSLLSDQE